MRQTNSADIRRITRRKALGIIAAPAAVALAGQAFGQAPKPNFTLLLVNDIYKFGGENGRGGYARVAAIAKAERARGVPVFFAHGGDCYSPSLMSGFDQGAHIVALQNMIGLDAFVPGNHEFDFGKDVYFRRIAEQNYPTFAANIRDAFGNPLANHEDSRLFELGGVKVGVIGLALDTTPLLSQSGDLKFSPHMEALRREAAELRQRGAEFLIALTHTDRAGDDEIVRSRLVDVLLTGHDHDLAVAYDGRTVMVESSEEGNYVTAIDISVSFTGEGRERRATWTPVFRVNDSRAFEPDPDVQRVVAALEAELTRELDVVLGTLTEELDSRTASLRSSETSMGNLIADAIKLSARADIAITNGGGIRGNRLYPKGHSFSRRDALSELPFGNATTMVEITGRDIIDALENGVSQLEQRAGRFPQVSGLNFEVDSKAAPGSRIGKVMANGQPLDPDRRYKVATNNFLMQGGDGYEALTRGKTLIGVTDGKLMANELMIHARRLGTIGMKVEGRIVIR
jgi:2',3'-cyclic-nucleotide 2'-phosphodiesterase (5'-nucleotidase family)